MPGSESASAPCSDCCGQRRPALPSSKATAPARPSESRMNAFREVVTHRLSTARATGLGSACGPCPLSTAAWKALRQASTSRLSRWARFPKSPLLLLLGEEACASALDSGSWLQ